jgi:hypothetical protein
MENWDNGMTRLLPARQIEDEEENEDEDDAIPQSTSDR